jgi:ankyrin repeat protein
MSDLEPMWDAIYDEDCDRISQLIDDGLGIASKVEGDDWNYLHMALVSISPPPSPNVVQHLISVGVDVNARDRDHWTPLHFAARVKSHECITLLLDAGADPNVPNNEGVTPLHQLLLAPPMDTELVGLMLEHGADPFRKHVECCAMTYMQAVACDEKERVLEMFNRHRPQ